MSTSSLPRLKRRSSTKFLNDCSHSGQDVPITYGPGPIPLYTASWCSSSCFSSFLASSAMNKYSSLRWDIASLLGRQQLREQELPKLPALDVERDLTESAPAASRPCSRFDHTTPARFLGDDVGVVIVAGVDADADASVDAVDANPGDVARVEDDPDGGDIVVPEDVTLRDTYSIQTDLQYLFVHRIILFYFLEKYQHFKDSPELMAKYKKFVEEYDVATAPRPGA
ncbi:hypothetical protein QR680_000403 [Steinernema hermaphroditum]|uniref:Uncharacterized protein n=1 Tax=Steinernema hermaphroditum TaxID=289476 RepID=A0AA39GVC2_9BILA|nr:hypothetical protein QR680_000403 [Steinernema hermaphroditum]